MFFPLKNLTINKFRALLIHVKAFNAKQKTADYPFRACEFYARDSKVWNKNSVFRFLEFYKKRRNKKLLTKLFTGFVVLFIIFQTLTPAIGYAEARTDTSSLEARLENMGGCSGMDPICWALKLLASVGYGFIKLVSVLFKLSAEIFGIAVELTLDPDSYNPNKITAVHLGWQISRDLANLFFIFIILTIAIATILNIASYNAKNILIRVIIIALFINFSFLITQQIILFTNSLAATFSEQITVRPDPTATSPYADYIGALVQRLNPAIILTRYGFDPPDKAELEAEWKEYEKTVRNKRLARLATMTTFGVKLQHFSDFWHVLFGEANYGKAVGIFIATFGGIAILMFGTLIIFLGAILLITRTIILWILLILAPLAFLFEALPATRGYANNWWRKLFNQAFFAPAFMFMLYLVIKIVQSGFLEKTIIGNYQAKPGVAFIWQGRLVMQYIVLLGLLSMSIMIARSLGAYGTDAIIKHGKWARKKARGYAGRIGRRAAGGAAERFAKGEGRVASTLRRIPLAGGLMQRGAEEIAQRNRAKIAEIEKRFSTRTGDELAAGASVDEDKPFTLVARLNQAAKKGSLHKVRPDLIKLAQATAKLHGLPTKEYEKYMPSLAGEEKSGMERKRAIEKAINSQTSDIMQDVAKNVAEFEKLETDSDIREAMQKRYGESYLKEIDKAADVNEDAAKSARLLFESFANLEKEGGGTVETLEDVADALEKMGNFSAAKFLRTEEGEDMFRKHINNGQTRFASKRRLDLATPTQQKQLLSRMTASDIENLDYSELKSKIFSAGKNIDDLFENAVKTFNPKQIRAIIDKGGEMSKDFIDKLERIAGKGLPSGKSDSAARLGAELNAQYKREDLQRWIESTTGKDLLGFK
jgi:hypothetical protein